METRIKNAAGALMLLSGMPAIAQDSAAKVSPAAGCASCPPVTSIVDVPNGPILLVAMFFAGVVVGYLLAKVLIGKKAQ